MPGEPLPRARCGRSPRQPTPSLLLRPDVIQVVDLTAGRRAFGLADLGHSLGVAKDLQGPHQRVVVVDTQEPGGASPVLRHLDPLVGALGRVDQLRQLRTHPRHRKRGHVQNHRATAQGTIPWHTPEMAGSSVAEKGPFFHGTRAVFSPGHRISAGWPSNYRPEILMNHVYFTALKDGAGLAAEIAAMLGPEGSEPHVYLVTPTGIFDDDPNVTDRKFPGNPTRSYRTTEPLVVIQEIDDWIRQTPESLETWRARLAALKDSNAEIIN